MIAPATAPRSRWSESWLDLLAFAGGLGVAWLQAWNTTDLVWSLWLSSLVVGYALIVWLVSAPLRSIVHGMRAERGNVPVGAGAATLGIVGVATLFGLAFFTVHFGGFHFIHSIFLNSFFPVDPAAGRHFPNWATYAEVFRRYAWFIPAAALAERQAFRSPPRVADTAVTPGAIQARLGRGDMMMAPYRNVIRMHLLIFFFAFAHFVRLDSFAIYAVAYAVYFFPWRLLRKPAAVTAAA
jgi:hypothetical protein